MCREPGTWYLFAVYLNVFEFLRKSFLFEFFFLQDFLFIVKVGVGAVPSGERNVLETKYDVESHSKSCCIF